MNLLELLKNQLTSGNTLGAISDLLGESKTTTQSGIAAALPTVLGSVIQSGSTAQGASSLLNLIKDGGHDGSILDNLGSILGGGGAATSNLLSSGSGLLSTLLGNKLGGIVDIISRVSGLKSGSTSSLLSLAAPLIMGALGKQVSTNNLGASGLTSLLNSQSDFVKAALPAGISNLLGFGQTMGGAPKQMPNVPQPTTGGFNWMPWVIGAVLLLGGLYGWKTCNAPSVDTAVVDKAKETVVDATKSATEAVTDAANKVAEMFKVSLPGGVVLDVPKGSLEDKMVAFVQSKDTLSKNLWFDFDRLLFETGKATLKPESAAQLANVNAIMKAFPAVKIKIGGYTDNVGNAASNLKLSAERAKNVMSELVKLGVDAKRMESEGYGDQHPVASNDTEEGRAQNRRISISVRAK